MIITVLIRLRYQIACTSVHMGRRNCPISLLAMTRGAGGRGQTFLLYEWQLNGAGAAGRARACRLQRRTNGNNSHLGRRSAPSLPLSTLCLPAREPIVRNGRGGEGGGRTASERECEWGWKPLWILIKFGLRTPSVRLSALVAALCSAHLPSPSPARSALPLDPP